MLFVICVIILFLGNINTLDLFRQEKGFKHSFNNNKQDRIIGGENARAGEFPFAAAIYIWKPNTQIFCSGTLLNNVWLLTAGQCVENANLFRIQLGTNKLLDVDPNRVIVSTDTFLLHPDYNGNTLDNDFGLIQFRLPITFNEYIQPITFLPVFNLAPYSSGSILGWGQTSDDVGGEVNDLQTVQVSALSNDDCKLIYGDQVTENMICVEGNYNEGTCIGDTGAPMVQEISFGLTILVGISSFHSGNGCESTDPSGFARVYNAREWIANITGFK